MKKYYSKSEIDALWELHKKRYKEISELEVLFKEIHQAIDDRNPVIYVQLLVKINSYTVRMRDIAGEYNAIKDAAHQHVKDVEAEHFLNSTGTIDNKKAAARLHARPVREDEMIALLMFRKLSAICESVDRITTISQTDLKWQEMDYKSGVINK